MSWPFNVMHTDWIFHYESMRFFPQRLKFLQPKILTANFCMLENDGWKELIIKIIEY